MRNRLRELRAARRWSQADLADQVDVSRQTVNALETGRYDPSLPRAFKIATVFDQPIERLLSRTTNPLPSRERALGSGGTPGDRNRAADPLSPQRPPPR